MSFNLDDPLAGILSDDSDDSFFDDDIMGKKKSKKQSVGTAEKKNALFDLGQEQQENRKFQNYAKEETKSSMKDTGIASKIEQVETKPPPSNVLNESLTPILSKHSFSKESSRTTEGNLSKTNLKFDISKSPSKQNLNVKIDKLNILDDLEEKSKKVVIKQTDKGKKADDLFNDILGPLPTKTEPKVESAKRSVDFDSKSILGNKDSKQSIVTTSKGNLSKQNPPNTNKLKLDTITKKSKDWLGIFQNEDNEYQEMTSKEEDLPSWLVHNESNKKQSKDNDLNEKIKTTKLETTVTENKSGQQDRIKTDEDLLSHSQEIMSSTILPNTKDDVTESTTMFLQQQESQMMFALQLKAQEEKVAALQMKQQESRRVQREAELTQRAHLDTVLSRQAEHRRQMQAIIAAHQERITERIKALLEDEYKGDKEDNDNEHGATRERMESPHVKEKKQLLQLVQSLQENHDKEIDLMETSYRRQLAFLEISSNQAEERMKEESEKLVKFYKEKNAWLEENHNLFKKITEDNLTALRESHKSENEILRQQHLENIKILQEHHATLLENIKTAVRQEQNLIQNSSGFSSELTELLKESKENKTHSQQLVERVERLLTNLHEVDNRSIQSRESQIDDMLQQLKGDKENLEVEKKESREIVKMLEARLKQMTNMIEEDSMALKQRKMEFEFDKATFSKQTEFAKNVLKKQEEEIKTLREEMQRQYQESKIKIEEERTKALKESASVSKEKASIQSLRQEIEKMKADLQAQMEEVSEERSKMNLEKQQLHMEEQRILAKSRDLDLLAKSAIEKQSQADKKYSEAEFIMKKYEERIRRIQEHSVSLNTREKQIAREKVALSRERLHLHNERKQMENKQQCSLCKSIQTTAQYDMGGHNYGFNETFLNLSVSKDYGTGDVVSAMNNIEQEMAYLMSRNNNLKHTTGEEYTNSRPGLTTITDEREGENITRSDTHQDLGTFKDYMDPKFIMMRMDVQRVIEHLDRNREREGENPEEESVRSGEK